MSSMDVILLAILVVNAMLSVCYSIFVLRKNQMMWLGLFFLTVPVLGFAIYFSAKSVLDLLPTHPYDRENLIKRYNVDRMEKDPEMERELDVIPVEDAMAVGSTREKRGLLLDQLKKDMQSNYKYILPASADSDSESAHYVAAGMMEVCRRKQLHLQELKARIQEQPDSEGLLHEYLLTLRDYMESGLITPKEAVLFKTEYCACFEEVIQEGTVSQGENAAYLTYLIDLHLKDKANAYWAQCPDGRKNEAAYRKMLEMYYNDANKNRFYACLDQLKASDIVLSPEGVNMVRFWSGRGESDPIG